MIIGIGVSPCAIVDGVPVDVAVPRNDIAGLDDAGKHIEEAHARRPFRHDTGNEYRLFF